MLRSIWRDRPGSLKTAGVLLLLLTGFATHLHKSHVADKQWLPETKAVSSLLGGGTAFSSRRAGSGANYGLGAGHLSTGGGRGISGGGSGSDGGGGSGGGGGGSRAASFLWGLCDPPQASVARNPYGRRRPLSWAAPHIQHDFRHWHTSAGVSREMLDAMRWNGPVKVGAKSDAFRFQIIGGQLFVDTSLVRQPKSGPVRWFPASAGEGSLATNGRAPLAMLALAELVHFHRKQLPDVDAVLQFTDWPMLQVPAPLTLPPPAPPQEAAPGSNPEAAAHAAEGAAAAAGAGGAMPGPLLSPCSNDDHLDVPFPDWTHWGIGGEHLQFEKPPQQQSWGGQRDHLLGVATKTPLARREPTLFYRGRASPKIPGDAKRVAVVSCGKHAPPAVRSLFDTQQVTWLEHKRIVPADQICSKRYLIYIESLGWSASLKYRLACGSVLLQVVPRVWEWFSRGLVQGTHFVQIPAAPVEAVCPAVVAALVTLEQHRSKGARHDLPLPAEAAAATALAALEAAEKAPPALRARRAAKKRAHDAGLPAPTQEELDAITAAVPLPDPSEEAARKRFDRAAAAAAPAEAVAAEAAAAKQASIAEEQLKFVRDRLGMEDVRNYLLDLLWAHADVLRYNVTPSATARPLTHSLLLEQFVFDKDRAMILAAYPWLNCGLDSTASNSTSPASGT